LRLRSTIGKLKDRSLRVAAEIPRKRRNPRISRRLALINADVDLQRRITAKDDLDPVADLVIVSASAKWPAAWACTTS
jgi:hypothetical protein